MIDFKALAKNYKKNLLLSVKISKFFNNLAI